MHGRWAFCTNHQVPRRVGLCVVWYFGYAVCTIPETRHRIKDQRRIPTNEETFWKWILEVCKESTNND